MVGCTVGALRVVKCICPAVRHQQRLLLCCVTPRAVPLFSLFALATHRITSCFSCHPCVHPLSSYVTLPPRPPTSSTKKQQHQLIYNPRTLVKLIR